MWWLKAPFWTVYYIQYRRSNKDGTTTTKDTFFRGFKWETQKMVIDKQNSLTAAEPEKGAWYIEKFVKM